MAAVPALLRRALASRYRLQRELGRGGMATVYLAQDERLARAVAVKVLHTDVATQVGVDRFALEIQTVAALSHPHILPLLDAGETEGFLYYVMRLAEGGTLRSRIGEPPQARALPFEDAFRIAAEVAEGLSYAHAQGVVHRDVKPENILFVGDSAVVSDFGVARVEGAARITTTGAALGTPHYMSPEQMGSGNVDARADVYGLGCVVYEMLTGTPPFSGSTAQELMARHALDPPPPLRTLRPAITEWVESVVLKALAKTPADRFPSTVQFADALRASAPAAGAERPDSIAVLPFVNLRADAETEYLGEALAEEIINALARIPGLRVAPRSSSFVFRGRAVDIAEAGAKLRVATVLEGSVLNEGARLRVTARLISVANQYQLWSERYDRDAADVFAIQDDIAGAIAGRLAVTFSGQRPAPVPRPTANLDAYHLYLQGRYYWTRRGDKLKRAAECFTQALTLDPEYALAHAGLADACTLLAQYGLKPPAAVLPRAREAAARALALAPELAEAHCAVGTLKLVFDWDWPGAETALRRAVELNPRYDAARYWLAFYLAFVAGRPDDAVEHASRAAAVDPLAALPTAQLGLVLIAAGRDQEAVATLMRASELDEALFLPYTFLGVVLHRLGRTDDAVDALEKAVATSGRHPWALTSLAVCQHARGRADEVAAIRDELTARARREYVQSGMLAILAAALGDVDGGFALLSRACDERDGIMIYSKRYPAFKVLQSDPRMNAIYARVGLTA